jgi:LysM repeat protein
VEDEKGRSLVVDPATSGSVAVPSAGEPDLNPASFLDPSSSPDPSGADTCRFLRLLDPAGNLDAPIGLPDADNRCVAVGEPTPQSARQQEIVCLTSGHLNCPRYLRGVLQVEPLVARRTRRRLTTPIVAANLALIVAIAASISFVFVRGGLTLPAGAAGPSQLALASLPASTEPSLAAVATPPPTPVPTQAPTPSPSPSPTPSPTAVSAASPSPAPVARATATPAPRSNRYDYLEPCPGTPNCWIYTVRSGDNFQSIVNWFGVPYNTVLRMNPQIHDPSNIRAGEKIRMPAPTR